MRRWLGIIDDPTPAGSTLDLLAAMAAGAAAIPAPTTFLPITTSQVDAGSDALERSDEVRGRRGNTAPISFRSQPALTFESRAYPSLVRQIVRKALGGAVTPAGVAPAAITSTFGSLQTGSLAALVAWLVREEQIDRLTGLWVGETELNFPIDEEGTISGSLPGLYHKVDDPDSLSADPNGHAAAAMPTVGDNDYTAYVESYMLRDAYAALGAGAGTEIAGLAGFGMTFNNGLIDDARSRFRPRKNIEVFTVDGVEHKLWFPNRHKLGAQAVTGRIDLSDVDAAMEVKRTLQHAEKLVFEVGGPNLGTTPEADDVMRLTFYKQAFTGGGADPIVREGDQVASYEFTAYIDPSTGKDLEASFVGAVAMT
jgi:hypothetical protein